MEIQPFNYGTEQVRVVTRDGEPWFVLTDLCSILGLSTPSRVAERLDPEGVSQAHTLTRGGSQQVTIVSEAGMYEVVIRSDKAEALTFRRWLTAEVLPTIRKTGGYGQVQQLTPEQIVHQALQITAAKVAELEARALDDAPKVEYVDLFVSPDDMDTIRALGNAIGEKEGVIRDLLIGKGWIYRKHIGRRYSVSKGHTEDVTEYWPAAEHKAKFRLVPQHNAPRHHNNQVRQTLYVTPEGKTAVARLFGKAAAA